MDIIKIKGLKIFANHGLYPEEIENGQDFFLDISLYLNTQKAGKTDDLNLTVDYDKFCRFVSQYFVQNRYNLLEAIAENLSRAILLKYFKTVKKIRISISKPNAPMEFKFQNVGVEIERSWHDVFIGIGSNIGDKEGYLKRGLEMLASREDVILEKVSTLIETKPYGGIEMSPVLNGVARIKTLASPHELLKICNEIENISGRKRVIRWGPRTLDIDILFYDNLIFEDSSLTIPHIDLKNRDFVLGPMAEIAPGFVHPVYKKNMSEMLCDLEKI